MTLTEIQKAFGEETRKYRKMYEDTLTEILQKTGLYGVDVILKETEQKGRLKIRSSHYSSIASEIVFVPYKKDGTLATTTKHLYLWDEDRIEEDLPEKVEIAPLDKEAIDPTPER